MSILHKHKPSISRQRGAALIILFMAMVLAGTAFYLSQETPEQGRTTNANNTSAALSKAKAALLSYAVSYYLLESTTGTPHAGRHGLLPCPERTTGHNGEGNSSSQCGIQHSNSIGRLPWKHLDIEPLKDATGECLWYAVSGGFYNTPKSPMTNDDTPGMFQIYNQSGTLSKGGLPENRIVAVVISPGTPITSQSRSGATTEPCKVPGDTVDITQYLESYQGISNSAVTESTADTIDTFIQSDGLNSNPQFNDRIITITAAEIFDAIKQNTTYYNTKIQTLGTNLAECLMDYGNANGMSSDTCSTLSTCSSDCSDAYNLCMADADSDKDEKKCDKNLKKCDKKCTKDCKKQAKPAKPPKPPKGGGGGGGGTGATYYRLPWPAPVNLAADYRPDDSYVDLAASDIAANGLLGRLPFDISNSSTQIGSASNTLFTECQMDTLDVEMFTLWQNWKDHWFYVVGSDFAPDATAAPTTPCTNCPTVGGTEYAAVLIFSDERINNQLRRTNETEVSNPALADSKASINNYLEGSNQSNYPDTNGNGTYGTGNQNDRLFCISEDLTTVTECTP